MKLRNKIDWFIYKFSWPFITRYLKSTRGVAYLHLLTAVYYHVTTPISDELRDATETFFNALHKDAPDALAEIVHALGTKSQPEPTERESQS